MDTKAAFEKWALSTYDLTESALVYRAYTNERTENAWRIWQESWYQSRAEIEIELPELVAGDYGHKYLFVARDVAEAITSHGIRIRGKME